MNNAVRLNLKLHFIADRNTTWKYLKFYADITTEELCKEMMKNCNVSSRFFVIILLPACMFAKPLIIKNILLEL